MGAQTSTCRCHNSWTRVPRSEVAEDTRRVMQMDRWNASAHRHEIGTWLLRTQFTVRQGGCPPETHVAATRHGKSIEALL